MNAAFPQGGPFTLSDLGGFDEAPARAVMAALTADLAPEQREELALTDLFARVRDEIAISRGRKAALLMPGNDAVYAATELTLALRFARPHQGVQACLADHQADRGKILQTAAALMAIAARLVLEGTPVFPGSLPGGAR
jgi:hypothetical protein